MARDNVIAFPKQSKFNISVVILLAVFIYMLLLYILTFPKNILWATKFEKAFWWMKAVLRA